MGVVVVAVITIIVIMIVAVMIAITIRMVVVGGNTMDNSFLYTKTLLLVDDELDLLKMLSDILKDAGFQKILMADTGKEAVAEAKKGKPDLIILDVMLPDKDGFSLMEQLRSFTDVPLIFLTAKDEAADKLAGLGLGADDYIVKPFNPMELLLRIKAILRRIGDEEEKRTIEQGRFKIDTYAKKVFKSDKEIDLTPKEYSIIKLFLENPEKAFSRDELMDLIWGENYIADPKIVDVNIRRLRSKIESSSSKQGYIETIWGFGYRWRGEEVEEHKK